MKTVDDYVQRGIYAMDEAAGRGMSSSVIEAHRHIEYVLQQGCGFIDLQEPKAQAAVCSIHSPELNRYYRLMDFRTIGICIPRQLGMYFYLKLYCEADDLIIVANSAFQKTMFDVDHLALNDIKTRLTTDNVFCMSEVMDFIRAGVPEEYKGKFKRAFLVQPAKLLDVIQAESAGRADSTLSLYKALSDLCVENPYIVKIQ